MGANILTYFRHRITNAVSEGLNSKIQTIKKMAYGFRNLEHFKTGSTSTAEDWTSTHAKAGRP